MLECWNSGTHYSTTPLLRYSITPFRRSLEELRIDYEDFLRQRRLATWSKDDEKAVFIRRLAYRTDRSYKTYQTYVEDKSPETAANTMICLIQQT